MSHERSLDVLLRDILDDFERLLNTAKNGPAKRRLAGRVDRIKLAIVQLDVAQDTARRSDLLRGIGA
jgi:hypothetical protein